MFSAIVPEMGIYIEADTFEDIKKGLKEMTAIYIDSIEDITKICKN